MSAPKPAGTKARPNSQRGLLRAVVRRITVAVPILVAVSVVVIIGLSGSESEVSALTEPADGLVNYETPHVYPIDLTPDRNRLVAVNTAAHRLEVFSVAGGTPRLIDSIPVGLDPVSVRARTNNEVWVVNHLSDSVSIIDLDRSVVTATLPTDNEPADVVFANGRAFVTASEANTVNVYRLADLAAPPQKIAIKGEDPRALAVSNDGSTVYAAIFESGNGTTSLAGAGSVRANDVVSRLEGPYRGANPPPNDGNALNPPRNPAIGTPPRNAMIVREDATGRWMDDNGGDWSIFVDGSLSSLTARTAGWSLADNDVAVIDTASLGVDYRSRLMNINMALAVNPATDDITVVGTEATNEVRFEPNLNGNFVRVMVANLGRDAGRAVNDLNPHLDYATPAVAPALREQSIGDPRGIAWNANGTRAFITGMGSNNVVVSQADGQRIGRIEVGEGPTGIVLDNPGGVGFVMNKFSGSISVVDLNSFAELVEVPFFDPTPQIIKDGRPFLYDTHLTSGTGHLSCASCHVDARTDRLAWNLGNPAGSLDTVAALDGFGRPTGGRLTVSPMKGPMLTQTLQDIMDFPSLHWRGDRGDLGDFNPTFVNLMGRPSPVSGADMDAFGDFLGTIHLPPNPYRNIDGSRPATITLPDGSVVATSTFNSLRGSNSRNNQCLSCHYRNDERNVGSNNELAQAFIPQSWVPWYDRLGYWPGSVGGSTTGFGYFHDGADTLGAAARSTDAERQTDMLAEIMTLEGPTSGLAGGERRQDTHAGVGQQVTIGAQPASGELGRANQLVAIDSGSPYATLMAKTAIDGVPRGFLHLGGGTFRPDRAGEANRSLNDLLAIGSQNPVTFTLVATGTEQRLGLDIDADGTLDGDEEPIDIGPGTLSGTVAGGDGGPAAGVKIDLFQQSAGGGRGQFLDSVTTDGQGGYSFRVAADCYVLTFIAPAGDSFNGSRWFQPARCVEAGQEQTIDAELDGAAEASLGGSVTQGGIAVAGVKVDLFVATADGGRGTFLGSTNTGQNGRFIFEVDARCYVLTFVAPDGETFGGSRWFQPARCVAAGQTVDDVDAQLDAAAEAALGGSVTSGGQPVAGVKVTFFEAQGDGSRGTFLGRSFTESDGRFSFDVSAGCFWAVFVAPSGQSFSNGSGFFEVPRCVESGEVVDDVDATISS